MMLELWYDKTRLGRIECAFEHQGTWFDNFHGEELFASDAESQRLTDFIDFCCDWYAREGSSSGANAAEFGAFDDILHSGLWYTIDETATKTAISDAPMFMDGSDGEISWITRN